MRIRELQCIYENKSIFLNNFFIRSLAFPAFPSLRRTAFAGARGVFEFSQGMLLSVRKQKRPPNG